MHPFFDLSSAYRLAATSSHWRNAGRRSVEEFMHALAREELRLRWTLSGSVPHVQPWKRTGLADGSIHRFLEWSASKRTRVGTTSAPSARPAPLVYGLPPTLWVADFVTEPQSLVSRLLSGAAKIAVAHPAEGASRLIVRIADLATPRQALLFFLTKTGIERISANLFGRAGDERECVDAVRRCLTSDALEDWSSAVAGRRSLGVSIAFSLLPAVTGIVRGGVFEMQVELGRRTPGLPDDCNFLLCLGPVDDS